MRGFNSHADTPLTRMGDSQSLYAIPGSGRIRSKDATPLSRSCCPIVTSSRRESAP